MTTRPFAFLLRNRLLTVLLLAALAPTNGRAQNPAKPWVSTWGTSMTGTSDPYFPVVSYNGNNVFNEQSIRLIVHTSLSGNQVRVRLSNELGATAVTVGAAHLALSDTGANIVAGSDHMLTFGGNPSVTIPPGAPALSDVLQMSVPARSNLAISLYLPGSTTADTAHLFSIQNNYISPAGSGDVTAATVLPLDATTPSIQSWTLLAGVEVRAKGARTFVALGSSITDGFLSTIGANHRWTDYLAQRLARHGLPVSTVNASLTANPLLYGTINALSRFDRDVLARPGVAYVFINDIVGVDLLPDDGTNNQPAADAIINGLRQYIARAHQYRIKAYAGTVIPMRGATLYSESYETKRQIVNAFIRSGSLDGYADFDAAVRDPADPASLLPVYDGGDHHHINDAGHKAVADSFDLALFQ